MMDNFSHLELDRFRAVIGRRLGLQFEPGRLDLLAEVLLRRLKARDYPSAASYLAALESGSDEREELRLLARELTVTETYLFRNPDHFAALAGVALPDRILARSASRRLRLLSAGCSSGEEAYSLAILVRRHFDEVAGWDVGIEGVDINARMLARAREARYSEWSLRETPAEIRGSYFERQGTHFVLHENIRSMVRFEERNLVDGCQPDSARDFDIVLCRNLLMYLAPEGVRRLIDGLTRALVPGGYLFLGHAETLRGLSSGYHLRHSHNTFYYQKKSGHEEVQPPDTSLSKPQSGGAAETGGPVRNVVLRPPAVGQHADNFERPARPGAERLASGKKVFAIPGPRQRRRAHVDLILTLELLCREHFREALEVLGRLPSDSTADPDVQLLRAVVLTNCSELSRAEAACRDLLAVDELNSGAHYVTALCREHARDPEGAREHDHMAIYLDPTFAMPHLHLGLLAKRSGDPASARCELEQAAALLLTEDASRILLFGGGFSREALLAFSRAELRACGGTA